MLNPFPELFFLELFVPLILRLFLGFLFLYFGYIHLRRERRVVIEEQVRAHIGVLGAFAAWYISVIEIIVGLFLIAGFLTQIAAIISSIIAIKILIFRKRYPAIATESISTYLLIFAISLSLLISGAGVLAIDIPL